MTEAVQTLRRPAQHRATPLRLSPQHGRPRCLMEELAQYIWHHKLLVYIAVIATASLLLEIGLGPALHHFIYG